MQFAAILQTAVIRLKWARTGRDPDLSRQRKASTGHDQDRTGQGGDVSWTGPGHDQDTTRTWPRQGILGHTIQPTHNTHTRQRPKTNTRYKMPTTPGVMSDTEAGPLRTRITRHSGAMASEGLAPRSSRSEASRRAEQHSMAAQDEELQERGAETGVRSDVMNACGEQVADASVRESVASEHVERGSEQRSHVSRLARPRST